MEPWEETIDAIYRSSSSDDQKVRLDVEKYLNILASNNADDADSDFHQLKGIQGWENAFQGAVHCKAMIASRNFQDDSRGVSATRQRHQIN